MLSSLSPSNRHCGIQFSDWRIQSTHRYLGFVFSSRRDMNGEGSMNVGPLRMMRKTRLSLLLICFWSQLVVGYLPKQRNCSSKRKRRADRIPTQSHSDTDTNKKSCPQVASTERKSSLYEKLKRCALASLLVRTWHTVVSCFSQSSINIVFPKLHSRHRPRSPVLLKAGE
jgi:hypothetical protein